MSVEIRPVMHFLWLKGLTAVEISREMGDVSGHAVLSLSTLERWLARFAAGDETLEDLPRSGRPRPDSNIALITQLLTDDPYLSQKMIATILSISSTTVKKSCLKICLSERLILNGFLIEIATIKSRKVFDFQLSCCSFWKHEDHAR
jgi:hypothetical protein